MKRVLRASVSICCLIAVMLVSQTAHADSFGQQSELIQQSIFYQRTITPPLGTLHSQRTLLAVSLAATETNVSDADKLREAYAAAYATENYRIDSDTSFKWDTDQWENDSRSTYDYNVDGNMTQVVAEEWVGSQWDNQSRTTLAYDGQGRLTSITTETWESNAWTVQGRIVNAYDGSGNISTVTVQIRNDSTSQWVNSLRTVSTYSGGQLIESLSQFWDAGTASWTDTSKSTYTYNGQGLPETITSEVKIGESWMSTSRVTNTYDVSNNLTQALTESWNPATQTWGNLSKTEYTFDVSNREILSVSSTWVSVAWSVSSSDTTKYVGDKVSETVHVDFFLGQVTRTLYNYDDINMTEEQIDQTLTGLLGASAEWVNTSREFFVFEAQVSAVMIDAEPWSASYELAQNYPNPFNPSTVIQFSLYRGTEVNISVFNLLGQLVTTLEEGRMDPGVYETTWNGTNASGQSVPSGIYFYRLTAGSQIETRKMIMLK